MREIKFRAFIKDTLSYQYGGFSIHATGEIESEWFDPKNMIIEQFTGKDKNGKDIYERVKCIIST